MRDLECAIAQIIKEEYSPQGYEDEGHSDSAAHAIIALPRMQDLLNCHHWVWNAIPMGIMGVDVNDEYKVQVFNALRDILYTDKTKLSVTPAPRPDDTPLPRT